MSRKTTPHDSPARRTRRVALALIALVILACYAVPYLLIGQVAAWYGSFLFWTLAGVAVIALNALAMAGLRATPGEMPEDTPLTEDRR